MDEPKDALREIQTGSGEAIKVFSGGFSNAIAGLSKMANQDIQIRQLEFKKVPIKDVAGFFGGPEAPIIAVYLEISGKTEGQMVVIYEPKVAFDLIDLLMGQAAGSTHELNDMERSVLGEVGNIMGSFFLNYISDTTGLSFQPSPPAVMMDMAGAILDTTLANLLEYTEDIYIMESTFGTTDRQVAGTFLVIPNPETGSR
jgi:chemotaxis protein CheC